MFSDIQSYRPHGFFRANSVHGGYAHRLLHDVIQSTFLHFPVRMLFSAEDFARKKGGLTNHTSRGACGCGAGQSLCTREVT